MDIDLNGHFYPEPETNEATMKFLALLADGPLTVLEDFHPGAKSSITLVDPESSTALTLIIFETG